MLIIYKTDCWPFFLLFRVARPYSRASTWITFLYIYSRAVPISNTKNNTKNFITDEIIAWIIKTKHRSQKLISSFSNFVRYSTVAEQTQYFSLSREYFFILLRLIIYLDNLSYIFEIRIYAMRDTFGQLFNSKNTSDSRDNSSQSLQGCLPILRHIFHDKNILSNVNCNRMSSLK